MVSKKVAKLKSDMVIEDEIITLKRQIEYLFIEVASHEKSYHGLLPEDNNLTADTND